MISTERCREILRSARGNTLVSLLAGLAIMEITGTALVSAMSQFSNQQAQLDLKTSGQSLKSEMADEFSKMSTCIAAIDTTSTLTQDPDNGTWPISMTVPDLPYTLLTSHSNRVLGSYGLKVNRLYMDRLADTGIPGPKGQKLYTGNVIIQFTVVADNMISLREQTVSQLFVEVLDGHIISCANGNDPTLALSSACNRVGGQFDEPTMTCSMDALSEAIASAAYADRKAYLDSDYRTYLNQQAQMRIDDAANRTYNNSVSTSNSFTDVNANQLNTTIVANTSNANTAITQVNNTLNQNANDLSAAINNANGITNQAQSLTTLANNNTAVANAQSSTANAHSASAQNYVDQANYISNQANATSDAARNTASYANSVANGANGTTGYANSVTGTANYYSNTANNTSNAANSTAGWANSTASSANNYATSAFNAAASTNNYANAAINTSNIANSASNNANYTSSQANNYTNGANWWYQQWAGRQSYNTYSYNYTSRDCTVGGANCSWQ